MFRHIVCFRIKDEEKAKLTEAQAMLRSLKVVPGVKQIEVGLDEKHSERSCDIALIVDFDSRADYEAYDVHELHQPVRAFMRSISASSVAVDFYRSE